VITSASNKCFGNAKEGQKERKQKAKREKPRAALFPPNMGLSPNVKCGTDSHSSLCHP
jgi:hypothetical protein